MESKCTGRRGRPAKGPFVKSVYLWLTDEQQKECDDQARRSGVTLQDYIRMLIDTKKATN